MLMRSKRLTRHIQNIIYLLMIRHYEGGLYGDFKMDAIWNHEVM